MNIYIRIRAENGGGWRFLSRIRIQDQALAALHHLRALRKHRCILKLDLFWFFDVRTPFPWVHPEARNNRTRAFQHGRLLFRTIRRTGCYECSCSFSRLLMVSFRPTLLNGTVSFLLTRVTCSYDVLRRGGGEIVLKRNDFRKLEISWTGGPSRLRMFIQIHIFMHIIEDRRKQQYVLPIKYYNAFNLDTLHVQDETVYIHLYKRCMYVIFHLVSIKISQNKLMSYF